MVHLQSFLFFPLLALATAGWSYRTQGRHGNPWEPKVESYPPAGSFVDEYDHVSQGRQETEHPMRMSSDAPEPYHEPGCSQGQGYVAESRISAATTKKVSWTPLLRDITLALDGIDSDKSTTVRVKAEAKNITPDGATIDVETWSDTKFYWGNADFVAWGDCASTLEHGTFEIWKEGANSKKIDFSQCYDKPPTIVVFFQHLDLSSKPDAWRVKAWAKDVTTTGFTVGASTWSSSEMYSVGVNWVAVPAESSMFRTGTYSTAELHDYTSPAQKHSKSLAFPSPTQNNATILTGLNLIDMSTAQNMRIKLTQDSVSEKGFTWHIDAWSDSKINTASASYIAF